MHTAQRLAWSDPTFQVLKKGLVWRAGTEGRSW